ncbi:MAG: twin-arginine translocase TatA/TatE family subunit [Thermoanaerobaculia bacterium]|nr:twin-arginine translocase TatA/TatE family subunit [Thermoanaerobaculia bacterium]
MGPLGLPELIFILVLALLIFGPRRLPQVGRTLGKAMGEFRRATSELTRTLNAEVALEEERPRRPAPAPTPGGAATPSAAATPREESPPSPATPEAGDGEEGEPQPADRGDAEAGD